ncbi:hypothetical protein PILCRDRAFT_80418 [Piloderma croceum F 1598]|uniref:Uncharacterized protein n=1 Tax=Piloderma croceum (strain F 1598) TaxID=765440 RepID=A0A0C3F273_PILCF|nr:hypothetical protein PILCRDRAFT_80418 [Piloderma croceum F 1598]
MKAGLKFNICNLETSYVSNDNICDLNDRIQNHIPDHLAYACHFWADHLQKAKFTPRVLSDIDDFLSQQLLFWLEVLSLVKEVHIASPALLSTADWAQVSASTKHSWTAMDANTFVTTFRYPITESVPHIYTSAVPFSPTESRISRQFRSHICHCVSIAVGTVTEWPTILNVIEGHTSAVRSVAFSPDGQQIVSGSDDQTTVQVWDAKTGEVAAGPFEGHTGGVTSVAFSPDGQQIVSGSYDQTVRVWDANTGEVAAGPFEGHTGPVMSVAFSPDGQQIVSGSDDQTVQVWDAKTGSYDRTVCVFVHGWLQNKNSELLFWLPPYYRRGLYAPNVIAVMGRHRTKLDFTTFVHGTSWTQCYSIPHQCDV